jgi:phosphatidylglycerol:prolipoprotein diacylglycerol transferase
MGITIDVSPIAFNIGSIPVRWYGITMAVGVLVLIGWASWQVRKGAKISFDAMLGAALVGIPSGIIFARLLHVLDQWEYYSRYPSQMIGGEGLSVYGAILGAAIGVWVYSRFTRINFMYLADMITPGIILAQAIGRVGCVFNGCCFGEIATNLPWGVIYLNQDCYAGEYIGIPVHPTHAYEILFLLLLFAVIMILRSKFKPLGAQFLFYMGMYGLWRIFIGYLRINDPFVTIGNFSMEQAQFIGMVSALICFPLFIFRYVQYRKGKITEEGKPKLEGCEPNAET